MKKLYIKDLKGGEVLIDELFRVDMYEEQTAKNGSVYIKVGLSDRTGKLQAKIWSNSIGMCAKCKKGEIVRINATIDIFNNSLQSIITKLSIITDGFNLSDFLSTSSIPGEEIFKRIESYINQMSNVHLKTFLTKAFSDKSFREKFIKYPAGKVVHHSYIGGLAEHVLDMLQISDILLQNHPLANKDIVRTGIILHDIGKLEEFEEDNLVFDYSVKGNMLGHIFIGANWFNKNIPDDFPEELRIRVTHIILSHHAKLEQGSPVTPKTYEAVIVSKVDEISSSLNSVSQAYTNYNGVNDFSEKLLALDNNTLYLRPFIDE